MSKKFEMNITRHIPNTITSMNLLCGVLGVICVFSGESDTAFLLMLLAAVCDFFDGFSARALKAYSAIGKELDSLADLVSFGLLPSLMLYRMMTVLSPEAGLLCYLPLLIVVASALRLAKFNTDDRQSENFLGLATPACAMICGSMTYYIMKDSERVTEEYPPVPHENFIHRHHGRLCRARASARSQLVHDCPACLCAVHHHQCHRSIDDEKVECLCGKKTAPAGDILPPGAVFLILSRHAFRCRNLMCHSDQKFVA